LIFVCFKDSAPTSILSTSDVYGFWLIVVVLLFWYLFHKKSEDSSPQQTDIEASRVRQMEGSGLRRPRPGGTSIINENGRAYTAITQPRPTAPALEPTHNNQRARMPTASPALIAVQQESEVSRQRLIEDLPPEYEDCPTYDQCVGIK
jgi:hypothetical protein